MKSRSKRVKGVKGVKRVKTRGRKPAPPANPFFEMDKLSNSLASLNQRVDRMWQNLGHGLAELTKLNDIYKLIENATVVMREIRIAQASQVKLMALLADDIRNAGRLRDAIHDSVKDTARIQGNGGVTRG